MQIKINRERLWELAEYEPHPGQLLYHSSKARFKGAACGRRWGKSKVGTMDKIDLLFVPTPKKIWWIISDSYSTGEEEFTYAEDAIDLICRKLGVKVASRSHNLRTGEMWMVMPWGSRIEVKSAQHPKALVGKGLGCATMAEAAKMDRYIWEQLISPALADFRAPADFLSTPEGDNWFKEIIENGETVLANGEPNPKHVANASSWEDSWESWKFPAWENPIIYPGGFDDPEIKREMKTPEGTAFFWQEIGARFGAMVGRIYPDFSRERHVVREEWLRECPNYELFDWGFTDPFVCLDMQAIPCDCGRMRYHIWREYYWRERTIGHHMNELKQRSNPEGFKIDCGFGDPARPEYIEEVGSTYCAMQALPDSNDFQQGTTIIQEYLNPQWCSKPHLTVDPACMETVREFINYRWPRENIDNGDSQAPRVTKGKPAKQSDHALDPIRYGLVSLEVLGAKHHLSELYSSPKHRNKELASVGGRGETFFSLTRRREF
jgi:hypothetical protein